MMNIGEYFRSFNPAFDDKNELTGISWDSTRQQRPMCILQISEQVMAIPFESIYHKA